jgi:predicted metal-dependent phosphoesterase TrpH
LPHSKIYADLHVHSSASDGIFSPDELVKSSKEKGLSVIALTDHDTIDGVAAAKMQGLKSGIDVIPGIELSCGWEGREASIHVLGLFIDEASSALISLLNEQKRFRYTRALKIVELLRQTGINTEPLRKKFESTPDKVLGRPHIARYLVETGCIEDFQQAFEKYLSKGCPAYVAKDHVEPLRGIKAIKAAGGIAVLAHPGLIPDWQPVWENIRDLPWDGIEVFYSEHNRQQVEKFSDLTKANNWAQTGGSDFHGEYGKHCNRLGNFGMKLEQYEALLSWCKKNRADFNSSVNLLSEPAESV